MITALEGAVKNYNLHLHFISLNVIVSPQVSPQEMICDDD